ncbi:MAG: UDP-N-acetylmuramoyl-L-alanyl-D-glutamate--2,6-diaminopimelate ligase, partial [Desulfatitalea sp.]|nr:UDP-N-acetylmuramoyl-L-alanyl-D-glutamate--2,6-diaminopimelate ligase [Desulfatitalea sp.]NNK00634.1 UDP-N-acetylmuramoyl-L-alanyl-D-glutamate--2,6-diaminopimelate ligase [Desulfatitalea sp.]
MKMAHLLASIIDRGLCDPAALQTVPGHLSVASVHYRAQEVTPGGLFVAVKGFAADGHDFAAQAVARGAAVVIGERPVQVDVPVVQVSDSRKALAVLAAEYFGHPSRRMTVVGITGTNGKTTTSYLIEAIAKAAGFSVGVIGTINYRYAGQTFDNPVTTPESLDLQRILSEMHAAGVTHVVMEISSHALALHRVYGCHIDVAVFTNLSQDHLDFHVDMADYWACKRMLFDEYLPAVESQLTMRAVVNGDDPKGQALAEGLDLPHLTTGWHDQHPIRVIHARFDLNGIHTRIQTPFGEIAVNSALAGRHNLENILNAVGVGIALKIEPVTIKMGIESLEMVPGRLERIPDPANRRFVFVDYAHTPDALVKALQTLSDLAQGRIIC